jgi:ribosomal protein L33
MAIEKDVRTKVILGCTNCAQKGANEKSMGISRHNTQKNRHNASRQLECKKKLSWCMTEIIVSSLTIRSGMVSEEYSRIK